MAKARATKRLRKTAELAVYTLTICGASLLLLSASFSEGTCWITWLTVAIVVFNGAAHTTSFLLEEIDRRYPSDVCDTNAHIGERGPSASTTRSTEDLKKSDDEVATPYLQSGEAPESATLRKGSVFSTNEEKEEDIANEEELAPRCRSAPEQKYPPTKRKIQEKRLPSTIDRFVPTTRANFRPLTPHDDSVLARSKQFRRLEGKLAAGIWYEQEYQKVKKLGSVFSEYDAVKRELLLKEHNSG
jgi:hypothetical protein